MTGYSGTPLVQKLGVKPGHRLALLGAPAGFLDLLGALPADVAVSHALGRSGVHDVFVVFVMARRDLEKQFAAAASRLDPAGGLWVAWPKKASGVATDLTEDVVRGVALAAGLVDVKVCAIDETWSGLKCVVRVKDRPAKAARKPRAKKRAK